MAQSDQQRDQTDKDLARELITQKSETIFIVSLDTASS
jgi:hypothetical protein